MATRTAPDMRLEPRSPYLSLALAAIQRAVAYRATTVFNLVANLAWVVILYYLWRTVFATSSRIGDFDWDRMRTYILIAYAVNALISFSTASRMMAGIRTGDIVSDLVHPVDYLAAQFVQVGGAVIIEGLVSSSIAMLLGFAVLAIAPPASPLAAATFVVSVGLGFTIKFLINFLVALLCFWTLNSTGLLWAQAAIINVFSGALIPLQLLPDQIRAFALASPLQAIVNTPLLIYLGEAQGPALVRVLAVQVAWAGGLWLIARLVWPRAVQALRVQGG